MKTHGFCVPSLGTINVNTFPSLFFFSLDFSSFYFHFLFRVKKDFVPYVKLRFINRKAIVLETDRLTLTFTRPAKREKNVVERTCLNRLAGGVEWIVINRRICSRSAESVPAEMKFEWVALWGLSE